MPTRRWSIVRSNSYFYTLISGMIFLRSFHDTKGHRVADQMHDAGLHRRLREHRADRLWKSVEPVDDRDQDVGNAPGLELVHHLEPELGAFALLDPQAEHLLVALGGDGERD